MTTCPVFPGPRVGVDVASSVTYRLTVYGPLPETEKDTFAVEMAYDGESLWEENPWMGGSPSAWIKDWKGERVLLRNVGEDEFDKDSPEFFPGPDDQLYCEEGDERASCWMREVTREEFDRIVKAEEVRIKMTPPYVPTAEDEARRAELIALLTD
jgi:hypothetical protein